MATSFSYKFAWLNLWLHWPRLGISIAFVDAIDAKPTNQQSTTVGDEMRAHLKKLAALPVVMAIASFSSTSAFAAYDKITPAKRPVISENGERRYVVSLDPLYTTTLEARNHGFIRPELKKESSFSGITLRTQAIQTALASQSSL